MAVSYNKLWKLLIDKGMTKTELRLQCDMATTTLAKLGKNEVISMEVLLRICDVLDCDVSDVMEIIKDKEETFVRSSEMEKIKQQGEWND